MDFIRYKTAIAFVIFMMTAGLSVRSDAGEAEGLRYTDCLERVLATSPMMNAVRESQTAAEHDAKNGTRLPNPELELEMEDVYGSGPFAGLDERETTVLVAQRLEIGGKRAARKKMGGIAVTLAELNMQRAIRDLTRVTRDRFAKALYHDRRVTLARETLGLSDQFVNMVQELLEAGAVPESDYRKALLVQMNAQMQLEQALADKAQSLNRLASLWNGHLSEDASLNAQGLFSADRSPFQADYPDATVLSRILDHQLKQKEAAEALSRKLRIPDITVKGGYKRFAGIDEYAFVAGISLEIPVFNSGKWAVATARSEKLIAASEIKQKRIELRSRYRTLYRQYQAVKRRIELLRTGVLPTTETEMNATLEAYRAGQFSYLQAMDSIHAWMDGRAELLDAQLKHHEVLAELTYISAVPNSSGVPMNRDSDASSFSPSNSVGRDPDRR